jgi:hypothetical protein
MPQNITISDLEGRLNALQAADFDMLRVESDGLERLYDICDAIEGKFAASEIAPLLFGFLERLELCDLGSPGPLVHTLESIPDYARYLRESALRKPTPLTVWMLNRLVNAEGSERAEWLELLRSVCSNQSASSEARTAATEFLEYQNAA